MMRAKITKVSVTSDSTLHDALAALDRTGQGILLLVDNDGRFLRTITDGDLRRLMLSGATLDDRLEMLPDGDSITAPTGTGQTDAVAIMLDHRLGQLPLVDEHGRVTELLLLRDLQKPVLLSTPHMGDEEQDFVAQAFDSNWIAPLGPNVDAFEEEVARAVNIEHAAALSSGTAAIHLALRLLDVGPGDRVFCSSLTFVASVNPIVYQGAEPVLIDSEPDSWNMSPAALERALEVSRKEGTLPRAVIVVSLYGQSADMDPLLELCAHYGVEVIEDAAESLGASYKGRASGTFGRLGVYSFNGNKIITTSGGGMLVSADESLISRAKYLSTQAREPLPYYEHKEVGYNYRMSNILAGVGRGQLRVLNDRVAARRRVFQRYCEGLADVPLFQWMPEPEWSYSTHWLSACTLSAERPGATPAGLISFLKERGIEARNIWKPMHQQPVFRGTRYFPHHEQHSVSDELFDRGVCLPSGSNLEDDQIEWIINELRHFSESVG